MNGRANKPGSNLIIRNAPELGNEGLSFRLTPSGSRCYSFVCPERGTPLPCPTSTRLSSSDISALRLPRRQRLCAMICERDCPTNAKNVTNPCLSRAAKPKKYIRRVRKEIVLNIMFHISESGWALKAQYSYAKQISIEKDKPIVHP